MQPPDYLSALDVALGATRFDLLPKQVAYALKGQNFVVYRVPDNASDTAGCTERFGIPLEDGAKTIVVHFKRGGAEHFAAVVALASTRIDVNGAVRRALGASRISFAPREDSVARCGMEYCGITEIDFRNSKYLPDSFEQFAPGDKAAARSNDNKKDIESTRSYSHVFVLKHEASLFDINVKTTNFHDF